MRSKTVVQTAPTPTLREAVILFFRLLGLVRPYWGRLARGLTLGLVVGLVGLINPYIAKVYFDNVYPARDLSLMHVLVIGAAALGIASAFMGGLRSYYSQVVASKLGSAVGLMYFNHLQHLPVRFFDEHRTGEVLSRLGDVRGALGTISRVFQTVLVNGVYLIIVPPFLALLNWKLALVALITTPLTVVITTMTSRIVRKYMKQGAEAGAELGAIQVEVISQIRTLKTLAAEHKVFRDVSEQTEEMLRAQLKSAGIGTSIGLVNAVIRTGGTAIFSWYAWTLIIKGDMSLGSFVAFGAYLGYLMGPVGALTGLFADFQQTAVTLGRAFEYLDLEPEQDPETAYSPPPAIIRPLHGEIRFESVSFGYNPEQRVLHDVSIAFASGKVTALVGNSGAGKSSVLRLLSRMADASSGSIRFDGVRIEQIPLTELRQQIGVVWQEPTLFRGTIWENLTFGLEQVPTRDVVEDAVRACRLDTLLSELPDGYDTKVAEWGATVSGGQRQRFAIVRALLRNTPILLLDEATSQVDVRTEEEVLRELLIRVRGKTVILVTHRLATASLADQICVLEAGRVVGAGTHDELLRSCDSYAQMVRAAQTGDEHRRMRMLGMAQ